MGRLTRGVVLAGVAIGLAGCSPAAAPVATPERQRPVSAEPSEVELSNPKLTHVAPDRLRFEVSYRFVKGVAGKSYMCELSFPESSNQRMKPMEWWELKPEGVIKDEIRADFPLGKKFEIRLSEAESPQDGYHKISNVVSGEVPTTSPR
jgi:hypothetical protein